MTPQQNACLIAIRDLSMDGVSPTYEQLKVHLGYATKATIARLVYALERQGYLRRDRYRQQGVTLIERHGASISDDRIASMSDDALASAHGRIGAALAHRQALSQAMRERAS